MAPQQWAEKRLTGIEEAMDVTRPGHYPGDTNSGEVGLDLLEALAKRHLKTCVEGEVL